MAMEEFSDINHGNRGGGPLHVVATHNSHGFMSSDDKALVDEALGDGGGLDAIESAIEETQSEAQNAATAIITEFRVMNYLLSKMLSTLDGKYQFDLEELRREASDPVEISVANELLMSILNALSNGKFNTDLDVLRQEN